MQNEMIRKYARTKDVRLWQIAEELGITDTTFSKRLRKKLSENEEKKVLHIIDKLSAEN